MHKQSEPQKQKETPSNNIAPKATFWRLVLSSFAAAVGVQSAKNLEQDFAQKSPLPFIVAGILFTVIFIASLVLIVTFVLKDT